MPDERNPWSIRGVSREARSKAAKAARRRHMTMGTWVDSVLTGAANAELSSRGPVGVSDTASTTGATDAVPAVNGLADRVEAVEERERQLRAMVQRAAERSEVAPEGAGVELGQVRSLAEAVYGLVRRIETHLRPAGQIGALIRRLDDSDRRQVQMLRLMERMVEADRRREAERDRLGAALARIESRLGDGRLATHERATESAHAAEAGRVEALDFGVLNDRAIANSRRAGQRPPDESAGLVGRLFGRRAG